MFETRIQMRVSCKMAWLALVQSLLLGTAVESRAEVGNTSPDNIWQEIDPSELPRIEFPPKAFSAFQLDEAALTARLDQAPREELGEPSLPSNVMISLPLPDGSFVEVPIFESPIMERELALRFPKIRTFRFTSQDRALTGRFDFTPFGLHALLYTPDGVVLVNPAADGDTRYLSSFDRDRADGPGDSEPEVGFPPEPVPIGSPAGEGIGILALPSGDTLRIYRLAVATTAQYYFARGGPPSPTDASVLASIVTEFNLVNAVYENEVAIRFVLIDNTDDLFFAFEPDGYTNGEPCTMRTENITITDNTIGANAYDIGHVFGTRVMGATNGGCANFGVACAANKADGASSINVGLPVGHNNFGGFRLVLHEMGHQFGAGHTWSGQNGRCAAPPPGEEDEFSPSNAYEPGSGNTIMSYSGICGIIGADNLRSGPVDTYFHTRSFEQVVNFSTAGGGNSCPLQLGTFNSAPVVNADPDFTIPRQTPFVLTGSATDPDGDPLTFTWEQFDLAAGRGPLGVDDGIGPIIRSFPPTSNPTRIILQLSDLINNTTTPGELLPQVDRQLTFRLTARDNQPNGGGVDFDTKGITAQGDPFFITSPNGGETLFGSHPVTWEVGGGSVASHVDILLSTDGGSSFETFLALGILAPNTPLAINTPNDGSEVVTLPVLSTDQARIMVKAVDNIFFDISDEDFSISCDCNNPSAILGTPGPDNLIGTPGPDLICGFEGNDNIFGFGGNDCINAGPGNNNVLAGAGNDLILSGQGNDNISGGPGFDTIDGGLGNDNCVGENLTNCNP